MIRASLLVLTLLATSSPAATVFTAFLTPEQVIPQNGAISPAGISTARATGRFELDRNQGDPRLAYELHFEGVNLHTDVTAVHIHIGYSGPPLQTTRKEDLPSVFHSQPGQENGPHALNIFGLPRQDDADLFVSPDGTWLRGVWDNGDRNFGPDGIYDPSDSLGFGAAFVELFEGDLYLQVHTRQFNLPDTGELRGRIGPVPEPTPGLLLMITALLLAARRTGTTG